jgi:transposase
MVRDLDAGPAHIYLEFEYRQVACSARFTQRYEDQIGRLCREIEMTFSRVAELNNLSWDQVWRMEKSYMRRLLEQHPPAQQLRAIGIDEVSIRKCHSYAIASPTLIRSGQSGWGDRAEQKRTWPCSLTK